MVYLDLPEPANALRTLPEIDVVLGWDRTADEVGAPRHVERLMHLLGTGKALWYRGGMETVHTAELIKGLGVERVVIGKGFYKTPRMPEHFVRRLGEACVPVVTSDSDSKIAEAAGAKLVWSETMVETSLKVVAAGYEDGTAWGVAVFAEEDAKA